MPRVSRKSMGSDLAKEIDDSLVEVLASFNSKRKLKAFLYEFLTKEERLMLARRLALYTALTKDYDYRQIHQTLHFSFETTRRAKEALEVKSPEFKESLNKLVKAEESVSTNRFLKFLEIALASKSSAKSRGKLTSGNY